MIRVRRLAITIAISFIASFAIARGNLKELTVPLKYVPQEGVHTTSADLPPALLGQSVEIRVEDGRKLADPLEIGHGTGGDDKRFPIHADHDVIAFIQEMITGVSKEWTLKQEHPAARTLILQAPAASVILCLSFWNVGYRVSIQGTQGLAAKEHRRDQQ